MKIKSLLIVALIALSLSLLPRSDKAYAASTCGGFVAPSMAVSWLPFGVVGFPYTNLFHLPTRFSDFTVMWAALEARAGAGVVTLSQVTVGGTGPGDPATTVIWQGVDFAADTSAHTEGTWLADYIFQPGDSATIYLDFDGTTTTLQQAFNATLADFGGTNFVIDPICPQDATSPTSSGAPAIITDGRLNPAWGDHFAVIYPTDGVGNPALRIYRVGDNSVGWLALAVNIDDIPAVSDENQLIASQNAVTVYLLSSGEIQITLGPDATGKIYTVIIDQLPLTVMHYSS